MLIVAQTLDDILVSNHVREHFGEVLCGIFPPIKVFVKVLWFEDGEFWPLVEGQFRATSNRIFLRLGKEVLHLPAVPKVWPVAKARKKGDRNVLGGISSSHVGLLHLLLHDLHELTVTVVFKPESLFNLEPPSQSRIDVL